MIFVEDNEGRRTWLLEGQSGQALAIEGYAAVYGTFSEPLPERAGCREVILPGAFSSTLMDQAKPCYSHREDENILAGADLTAWADEWGLAFRITNIPALEASAGLVRSIGEGGITKCSFAFLRSEGEFIDHEGEQIYALNRVMNLLDVAICWNPAFELTGCWLAHSERLDEHQLILRDMFDTARLDPQPRPATPDATAHATRPNLAAASARMIAAAQEFRDARGYGGGWARNLPARRSAGR